MSVQRTARLLFSVALPVLLLLIFVSSKVTSFDWVNGFNHPLTGWDHLVTMLAVGIWAAQLRGQAIWMLPLAFVGVMSLGGLAGAAGIMIPSVEGIILLSCAVFSVLITRKIRFSAKINVMIVAFFAFFHGFAHGQEISTSASLISYTLGFMLATLLLHGAGILVAKLVIFSVTCLLTALFSSAALAKNAASMVDDGLAAGSNGLHTITHIWSPEGATAYPGWLASNMSRSESCRGLQADAPPPTKINISLLRTDLSGGAALTPQQSISEKLKSSGHSNSSIFKQAALQIWIHWRNPMAKGLDVTRQIGLDFRHFFPNINHTPGNRLLSNGVGLTSPPVAVAAVFVPQTVLPSRNTPIPFIEEPNLRLTSAKFDIGKRFRKSHTLDSHAATIYALGHGLSISNTTIPQPIQSFSSLLFADNLCYRDQIPIVSSKQLPVLMASTVSWQSASHCPQFNTTATDDNVRRYKVESGKNQINPAKPIIEKVI